MRRESRQLKFSRFPMMWIVLAFAAGILAGENGASGARTATLVGSILALVLGIVAFAFRGRTWAIGFILAGFVGAGAFASLVESGSVRNDRVRAQIDDGSVPTGVPLEIEGVLSRPPDLAPDGFSFTVAVSKISDSQTSQTIKGLIRIYVQSAPEDAALLHYGSRIRALVKLRRDDQFLNPGVISQREMLDQLRLDAFGSIRAASAIEILGDDRGFPPVAWIYDQRSRAIATLRANLSPRAAGVMIASLLGNDQFLDKQTASAFREGGTYHLLVISGFHLTVIGAILLFILSRVSRNRWLQFAVTSGVLWAYALAVGAEPPVTRAAAMFTVLLFGYAVRRDTSSLNLLALTAFVLLVFRPSNIFSPSFQLTFVSVATVFAIVVPLLKRLREIGSWTPSTRRPFPPNVPRLMLSFCEWLYWDPAEWKDAIRGNVWSGTLQKGTSASVFIGTTGRRLITHLFEMIAASTILQIALLPMSVLYFHRISIISIANNLWAGAVMGAESFAAVCGVALSPISLTAAAGCFGLVEIFNRLLFVPSALETTRWASFRVPEYSGPGRIFYSLIFAAIFGLAIALFRWRPFELRHPSRAAVPAAAILGVILFTSMAVAILHPFSSPQPNGKLRIDFLDVGQGDSALITFPDGETMLVDAGGSPEFRTNDAGGDEKFDADRRGIGEAVVSEYLWYRGYSKIDYLLATHSDGDHIGGMPEVAKNFDVDYAILGRVDDNAPTARFLDALSVRKVPLETLAAGDMLNIGEVQVSALNPLPSDGERPSSANNSSVVLQLKFGSKVILMTGDIEADVERRLAASPDLLRADVVKVAHHGSRTSSTSQFVDRLRPELAVVSVGRRSPYGHPHVSVLRNWRDVGANVITTGEHGTITVMTDGNSIEMTTYLP